MGRMFEARPMIPHGRLMRSVLLCWAVLLSACNPPPSLLLTITDPQNIAVDAVAVAIGDDPTHLAVIRSELRIRVLASEMCSPRGLAREMEKH